MDLFSIIILIIVIIGFSMIFFTLNKVFKRKKDDQSMILLQNQINEMSKALSERFDNTHKAIQQQYGHSTKIIQEVTKKLTQLDNTNKQVVNFAKQLQSLENILKNPKQRGILGEYFLETLLANILPPNSYKMQYAFKNGETVDAIILVKDKIIPIDAKFSLEKYNLIMEETDKIRRDSLEKEFKADIKKRIDETSKYIRPEENTTDFAFMFIPAEGVFYNLLIYKVGETGVRSKDLVEYSFSKKVIIVSPTSFFAYLQTVIQALKSLQVEEGVKEVIKRVGELNKHLLSYDVYMQKLGNNLGTVVNMYNSSYKEFKKIDKDVTKITGAESKIEPLELDRPQQ